MCVIAGSLILDKNEAGIHVVFLGSFTDLSFTLGKLPVILCKGCPGALWDLATIVMNRGFFYSYRWDSSGQTKLSLSVILRFCWCVSLSIAWELLQPVEVTHPGGTAGHLQCNAPFIHRPAQQRQSGWKCADYEMESNWNSQCWEEHYNEAIFLAVLKDSKLYSQLVTMKSHGKCPFLCAEHLVSVISMFERGFRIKDSLWEVWSIILFFLFFICTKG